MFASSLTRPAARSLPFTWGRRACELTVRGVTSLAREIRIRRDLRIASGLDEAMLRDIGIARGGLEGAVRFGRAGQQPEHVPHAGEGCRSGNPSTAYADRKS